MKALVDYLQETFGQDSVLLNGKEDSRRLPLYLRGQYDLYSGSLNGVKVIWAWLRDADSATPGQLKKQSLAIQNIVGYFPVVFVFDKLDAWQRKRLIEKKVGFAEPFRQIYIPELYTHISDGYGKEREIASVGNPLKAPAQFLLLYHLQVQDLEGLSFQEIAGHLDYSAMTITRSIRELIAHSFLRVEGKKEKTIVFEFQRKELWDKALPFLNSPVRETWYTDIPPYNEHTRSGGETALAFYSMLSEPRQHTTAIGKDAFRLSKLQFGKLDKRYGVHKLEVWNYDPAFLSKGNQVDRLSLYLSLKNHHNERVQSALLNMINEFPW